MYRDLLDHEDLAAAHPAVGALAAGGPAGAGRGLVFDEIPEHEIDSRAAPETTPVVLDADASQRAAIAAALDGRSFVLDGPPGTGKSQTIANIIGAALHAGKTVLFVSEKAAALDVVRDRLASAGLGALPARASLAPGDAQSRWRRRWGRRWTRCRSRRRRCRRWTWTRPGSAASSSTPTPRP